LLELEREVTVTLTLIVTFLGEPVMLMLLIALVEFRDWLKNGVELATSSFALTSIFTPEGGRVDLMVMVKGKSGPGAGAWLLPEEGFISTLRAGSLVPPPPLFLQLPDKTIMEKLSK